MSRFGRQVFIMPNTSIIMPCFNHGRFVAESVQAILRQTDGDFELLIVDDRSSDNSWHVIQALARADSRIHAIRHDANKGASCSRNDALQLAAGDFIGFCDADDIWERDKLRFQVELLKTNSGFDVTYCDSMIIDEGGQPVQQNFSDRFSLPKEPSGNLFPELLVRNFVNMQSVLIRRECFQQVGFFDETIKWVEDWLYWLQVARRYRFLYSDRLFARYRVHSRSTNLVQKRGAAMHRVKVLRQLLGQYDDLSTRQRTLIYHNIGGELCDLGKQRTGRIMLRRAVILSLTDARAFWAGCKAALRLLRPSHSHLM